MIAVVQRAAHGSCTVDGKVTGSIGKGLVILLGVMQGDTDIQAKKLAARCVKLRCFTDENDKMNLAVKDVGGSFLVISQFTLCADTASGNRPSFSPAAKPDVAVPLYELFVSECRSLGVETSTGIFGADMDIELCNQGPVTFILEE
ncbi:MAG: D-tyrosyl-tRNA(Tyr) deacylase [Lentisphaeria bacterium]|nr:D-tyrosyl-tRNA(Tyr) deacylase [Lentisphaeria bacterium]MBR7118993.1 D-tyrosyl-tRNA(Tyr) deacylase [Lentisphaeria bacterium]